MTIDQFQLYIFWPGSYETYEVMTNVSPQQCASQVLIALRALATCQLLFPYRRIAGIGSTSFESNNNHHISLPEQSNILQQTRGQ